MFIIIRMYMINVTMRHKKCHEDVTSNRCKLWECHIVFVSFHNLTNTLGNASIQIVCRGLTKGCDNCHWKCESGMLAFKIKS